MGTSPTSPGKLNYRGLDLETKTSRLRSRQNFFLDIPFDSRSFAPSGVKTVVPFLRSRSTSTGYKEVNRSVWNSDDWAILLLQELQKMFLMSRIWILLQRLVQKHYSCDFLVFPEAPASARL
jgi:hypothetical protein